MRRLELRSISDSNIDSAIRLDSLWKKVAKVAKPSAVYKVK
jgi:hypothetical protein